MKKAGVRSSTRDELHLLKARAGYLAVRRPTTADKLVRFACQLLVLALVKGLGALSVPFGRLFAVYWWAGKSLVTLSLFLEKQLLKAVGYLGGTAYGREDGRVGRLSHYYFGADVKRWHVGVVALVLGSLAHATVRRVRDQFDERVKRARLLRKLMRAATTYHEWRQHAEQLERLEGEDKGAARKAAVQHEAYDRKLLLEKTKHLNLQGSSAPNVREIMMGLRVDLIRNIANIAKSQKHRQNFVCVPQPIHDYITEVQKQLLLVANWPELDLSLAEKLQFFRVTRHTFGRTALLLSGGGGLGTFHLGVCKALFERGMLPRILAGSSVGSIVCAVIGTKTDDELRQTFDTLDRVDIGLFQNSKTVDLMTYALRMGHLQDIAFMVTKLRQLMGDFTFQEAYERSGRILNVTVCPADTNEPPRLLNYMTAPQCLVWSAVAASSSFPGLYPPQNIVGRNSRGETYRLHAYGGSDTLQRRWRDGSLEFDLPVQAMAEMFNCNHFLVSQTNPHIVPLLNFKSMFPQKWASIMEAELKHRLTVFQYLFPDLTLSKYLTLFTQPWEGDITFTLPSALWNVSKTIMNPTQDDLMLAVRNGELATWERMSAIECNCTLEATLDACLNHFTARLRLTDDLTCQRSIQAIGTRIPSWLHMPTLPPRTAWGDAGADTDLSQVSSWGQMAPPPGHAAAENGSARGVGVAVGRPNNGGVVTGTPMYRCSYSHSDLIADLHYTGVGMGQVMSNGNLFPNGGTSPQPPATSSQAVGVLLATAASGVQAPLEHCPSIVSESLPQGLGLGAQAHARQLARGASDPLLARGGNGSSGGAPTYNGSSYMPADKGGYRNYGQYHSNNTLGHHHLPSASSPALNHLAGHSMSGGGAGARPSGGRLATIASSRSSLDDNITTECVGTTCGDDYDHASVGFDSASSVAVGGVPGANGGSGGIGVASLGLGLSSSSRMSRRNSLMAGLHALAGPEHDDLVTGGQSHRPALGSANGSQGAAGSAGVLLRLSNGQLVTPSSGTISCASNSGSGSGAASAGPASPPTSRPPLSGSASRTRTSSIGARAASAAQSPTHHQSASTSNSTSGSGVPQGSTLKGHALPPSGLSSAVASTCPSRNSLDEKLATPSKVGEPHGDWTTTGTNTLLGGRTASTDTHTDGVLGIHSDQDTKRRLSSNGGVNPAGHSLHNSFASTVAKLQQQGRPPMPHIASDSAVHASLAGLKGLGAGGASGVSISSNPVPGIARHGSYTGTSTPGSGRAGAPLGLSLSDADLIALATQDVGCTGSGNFWDALLPLAGTSENLQHQAAVANGNGSTAVPPGVPVPIMPGLDEPGLSY